MSVKTQYGIVWKHIVLIRMHYGNINLRIMDTEKYKDLALISVLYGHI